MDLTNRVDRMDEELKLVKNEIKQVLLEIQEQVLNTQNPFSGLVVSPDANRSPAESDQELKLLKAEAVKARQDAETELSRAAEIRSEAERNRQAVTNAGAREPLQPNFGYPAPPQTPPPFQSGIDSGAMGSSRRTVEASDYSYQTHETPGAPRRPLESREEIRKRDNESDSQFLREINADHEADLRSSHTDNGYEEGPVRPAGSIDDDDDTAADLPAGPAPDTRKDNSSPPDQRAQPRPQEAGLAENQHSSPLSSGSATPKGTEVTDLVTIAGLAHWTARVLE